MSYWGNGVSQSDEYAEVYERFMEDYDRGRPVAEISTDILEEYLDQFEADDGVLHDVYFAIAKAEWMCGGVSSPMLERVRDIVDSDKNLDFLRELEASEDDIKQRKKNLQKFLCGLEVPRAKPRKRKIPEDKYVPVPKPKSLPAVSAGDVLCYIKDGKYRPFALSEKVRLYRSETIMFCYAWCKDFDEIPVYEQLLKEKVLPLGWINGKNFPEENEFCRLGNFEEIKRLSMIYPQTVHPAWKKADKAYVKKVHFEEIYPEELCVPLEKIFEKINYLRHYE